MAFIFPTVGQVIYINCSMWCCRIINSSVAGIDHIFYSNFPATVIFLWNVLYLAFRLNKKVNAGTVELLRIYHVYSLVLSFWFILTLVTIYLPISILVSGLNKCLYITRAFMDNFIIFLACFNEIYGDDGYDVYKSFGLTLVTVGFKVGIMFTYKFTFNCGLCGIFFPAPQSVYSDIAFLGFYIIALIVLQTGFPIKVRISVRKWIVFLITDYFIRGFSTLLLVQNYDFALCINTLEVWISSLIYGPLIFHTFLEDTTSALAQNINVGDLASFETDTLLYYGSKIKEEKNSIMLIDFEDLKFGPKIGIGGYGEVSLGRWHHTEIAIKRVFQKRGEQEEVDNFLKEIKLMSKLSHPNILLFIGACITATDVYIVTEYMAKGSVYSILHSNRTPNKVKVVLRLERKLKMLLDTAKGMLYLHTFQPPIIHRDLKTQNLLVDEYWRIKLCDFGLSRIKIAETMSRLGTLQYSAPEILRGERYNERADIYSFGIIIWEILTESIPYDGWAPLRVASDVAYNDRRPEIPCNTITDIKALMQAAWNGDANLRPDFSEIIPQLEEIIVGVQNGIYEDAEPQPLSPTPGSSFGNSWTKININSKQSL